MEKQILVAEEVAKILRVDIQRVYQLAREDQLPGVIRLGQRQYRFSAFAINQLCHGNGNNSEKEGDEK